MNKFYAPVLFYFVFVSSVSWAQSPVVKALAHVQGDSLHIRFTINDASENAPILGSSGFAVKPQSNGLHLKGTRWVQGVFSPLNDPDSYREMGLYNEDRLAATVYVKTDGSGKGKTLGNEELLIAEAVVPITDPCGAVNMDWINRPTTVNTFYKTKKGKSLDDVLVKQQPSAVALLDSAWLRKPVLQINEGVLAVELPGEVTWWKDGEEITGEKNKVLLPEGPGVYQVTAVNPCGTLLQSDAMDLRTTDLAPGTVQQFDVKCHPNPFASTTTVTYALPTTAQLKFSLYSLTGVQVMEDTQMQDSGKRTWVLDADKAGLSAGVYLLKGYVNNEYAFVKKLVVEK